MFYFSILHLFDQVMQVGVCITAFARMTFIISNVSRAVINCLTSAS